MTDAWDAQMKTLGGFIRSQRKLANLSLRQLALTADEAAQGLHLGVPCVCHGHLAPGLRIIC